MKIKGSSSSLMPHPESSTFTSAYSMSDVWSPTVTDMRTVPPSGVNFTALDSRFWNTDSIFTLSSMKI